MIAQIVVHAWLEGGAHTKGIHPVFHVKIFIEK